MDHDDLYDAAVSAASKLHGDTSVSRRVTLRSLRDLRDEIDIFIDAVESDVKRDDREAA